MRGTQRRTMRFVARLRDRPRTDNGMQDREWTWVDARVYAPQILRASLCRAGHPHWWCVVFGKHHGTGAETVRILHDCRVDH